MQFNPFSALTKSATALAIAAGLSFSSSPASAQDTFVGQITMFGMNYCPRGWAAANGQLLPISSNDALFSLLGTTYGGDGRTTFALPDLRGRFPTAFGSGPGLTPYAWGEKFGSETFSIENENQLPKHNHLINATNATANKGGPGTDFLAVPDQDGLLIYHEGPPTRQMDPGVVSETGSSAPIYHQVPGLAVSICIAMTGLYPSRN